MKLNQHDRVAGPVTEVKHVPVNGGIHYGTRRS